MHELIEIIYCVVTISFLVVIAVSIYYGEKLHITPTPVLPKVKRKAVEMLEDYLNGKDVSGLNIVDLGSGWGGLLKTLNHKFPNAKLTGYEFSIFPFVTSKLRFLFSGKKVQILKKDFFKENLSDYDVIICYLSPWHMAEIKKKFPEMKKGAIIISCSFAIPDVKEQRKETLKGIVDIPVYLYYV